MTERSPETAAAPAILMSGTLFDGTPFEVRQYAWERRPEETRYDVTLAGALVASNCRPENLIGWLATALAKSFDYV